MTFHEDIIIRARYIIAYLEVAPKFILQIIFDEINFFLRNIFSTPYEDKKVLRVLKEISKTLEKTQKMMPHLFINQWCLMT